MNQWRVPRLWQSPSAPVIYADEALRGVRQAGFDSVRLRGRRYDVMSRRTAGRITRRSR